MKKKTKKTKKTKTAMNPACSSAVRVNTPELIRQLFIMRDTHFARGALEELRKLLVRVGERASQLNDPIMNALMCLMTIYAIADPQSREYDPAQVSRLLIQAEIVETIIARGECKCSSPRNSKTSRHTK